MAKSDKTTEPKKYKMILTAKGVRVEKLCNDWERRNFILNEPAKHGLLFSGKPYAVGTVYLENI